jgi:SLT domain-containing protein
MGGAGGAGRWRGLVGQVLKELKLHSGTNVNNVLKAIAKESGGNPRAVNRGDVNARNGDPSKGLLQVIGSTFRRYAGKYKSRGQFDPHANIYAGVNYAHHRYGKRWSQRMAAPGGYFAGIRSAPQGPAWVGERGPELMNFRGGESVTPVTVGAGVGSECNHYHFDNQGTIYTKSSREFEDMLATAMQELSRKGKLPKK